MGITYLDIRNYSENDKKLEHQFGATGGGARNWSVVVDTYQVELETISEKLGKKFSCPTGELSLGRKGIRVMKPSLACSVLASFLRDSDVKKAMARGEFELSITKGAKRLLRKAASLLKKEIKEREAKKATVSTLKPKKTKKTKKVIEITNEVLTPKAKKKTKKNKVAVVLKKKSTLKAKGNSSDKNKVGNKSKTKVKPKKSSGKNLDEAGKVHLRKNAGLGKKKRKSKKQKHKSEKVKGVDLSKMIDAKRRNPMVSRTSNLGRDDDSVKKMRELFTA